MVSKEKLFNALEAEFEDQIRESKNYLLWEVLSKAKKEAFNHEVQNGRGDVHMVVDLDDLEQIIKEMTAESKNS